MPLLSKRQCCSPSVAAPVSSVSFVCLDCTEKGDLVTFPIHIWIAISCVLRSAKSHAVVNETVGTLVEWAIEILLLLNEVHPKCPINHNIEPPWGDLGNFTSKTLSVTRCHSIILCQHHQVGSWSNWNCCKSGWVIAHINIYSHSYHCITRQN